MSVLDFMRWFLRSRYTLALEDEVARLREEVALLRAENRALVNSLLGTAGIPPIEIPGGEEKRPEIPRVRRRSWHQIQRQHELGESRREQLQDAARFSGDGETTSEWPHQSE